MRLILIIGFAFIQVFMFSGCTFKLKVKEVYYSDQDLINYVKQYQYPFDAILKFKSRTLFESRAANSITQINFMNVYGKENQLLKATDGDNCEFKVLQFLKDSLDKSTNMNSDLFSLNEIVSKTSVLDMNQHIDVLENKRYKILVGWSISLNKFRIVQNRLETLNAQLKALNKDILIIGLNLDRVK